MSEPAGNRGTRGPAPQITPLSTAPAPCSFGGGVIVHSEVCSWLCPPSLSTVQPAARGGVRRVPPTPTVPPSASPRAAITGPTFAVHVAQDVLGGNPLASYRHRIRAAMNGWSSVSVAARSRAAGNGPGPAFRQHLVDTGQRHGVVGHPGQGRLPDGAQPLVHRRGQVQQPTQDLRVGLGPLGVHLRVGAAAMEEAAPAARAAAGRPGCPGWTTTSIPLKTTTRRYAEDRHVGVGVELAADVAVAGGRATQESTATTGWGRVRLVPARSPSSHWPPSPGVGVARHHPHRRFRRVDQADQAFVAVVFLRAVSASSTVRATSRRTGATDTSHASTSGRSSSSIGTASHSARQVAPRYRCRHRPMGLGRRNSIGPHPAMYRPAAHNADDMPAGYSHVDVHVVQHRVPGDAQVHGLSRLRPARETLQHRAGVGEGRLRRRTVVRLEVATGQLGPHAGRAPAQHHCHVRVAARAERLARVGDTQPVGVAARSTIVEAADRLGRAGRRRAGSCTG